MNFKYIAVGLASATALAAGSLIGVSPAEALIIGGSPNYAPLTTLPTTLTVSGEFNDGDLTGGFTNVTGLLVNSVDILTGSSVGGTFNAHYNATPGFLTNFKYGGVDAVLNLLSGQRVTHTIDTTLPDTFTSTVDFELVGEIRALVGGTLLGNAIGGFSAGKTFKNNVPRSANFSLDLTATPVPTPALLPGLIALGAGVLRKRKAEVAAEAEA